MNDMGVPRESELTVIFVPDVVHGVTEPGIKRTISNFSGWDLSGFPPVNEGTLKVSLIAESAGLMATMTKFPSGP